LFLVRLFDKGSCCLLGSSEILSIVVKFGAGIGIIPLYLAGDFRKLVSFCFEIHVTFLYAYTKL
jgi:hypothetical protein